MERMLAGVVVVQDDLYNLTLLKNKRVGIAAVDRRIRSCVSSGKDRVQGRDLWCDISDVVEEGTGVVISIATSWLVER